MATKRAKRYAAKRIKYRKKFWPEIDEDDLWLRSDTSGFTTIPRGLSLITRIQDALSPGKPLAGTYLALWCYSQDEMVLTLPKPRQMALESGFTGQRAVYTWTARMKKLEELGFIKSAAGVSGPYHYVLLMNPYFTVSDLRENLGNDVPDALFNTLVDRIEEIGEASEI